MQYMELYVFSLPDSTVMTVRVCVLYLIIVIIGVGLCSGRQIRWGEIFQACLKCLSPTNCRLSVGYMLVWCRFCRGAFGDVSVLIRPPMVDGLLVMYRAYVGRPDTNLRPNLNR